MSFSEEEREEIERRLIETAAEKFATYGHRKTTIADVTDPVGISTGSFYLFFDSKADLVETIVNRERARLLDRFEAELDGVSDARDGLERLFHTYASFLEENEFVQGALFEPSLTATVKALPESELEARLEFISQFGELLEPLRDADGHTLRDVDVLLLVGVMSTVLLLVSNRELYELYDPAYYEELKGFHVETIARGLTTEEPPAE